MRNRRTLAQVRKRRTDIGIALCYVGWFLFVLSMFLPAACGLFSGWYCARESLFGLFSIQDLSKDPHYCSLALANILFVLSPFALRWSLRENKSGRLLMGLLVVATLDVAVVVARFGSLMSVGYYVWALSFALVTAGSILLLKSQRKTSPPVVVPSQPRTPEELAALRELESFLGSKIG